MWIEQLNNGKYRAVERYTDPITGKQKKVSITIEKNTAATRKAAEKALFDKIDKKLDKTSNCNLTFSQLVDHWREYQKSIVKESTLVRNKHVSNTLITIIGKDSLVDNLTAGYVAKQLMKHSEKPCTYNERLTRFKSILRFGFKFDYVKDVSWLDKLDPMKDEEKETKLSEKYLESDELKDLLKGMKVERWASLTRVLVLTGLRVGEAFALTAEDIDVQERQIHVIRTFDVVNDKFTSPKTKTSVRDVYITDELLPLCKSLRSDALERKLSGGNGMIFYTARHDYYSYLKYFKACTKTIIGRQLTVHALRHTHTSLLAEQGVSLDTISRRLGHESSDITRKVYFHVTEKLREKENEQLKKISLL